MSGVDFAAEIGMRLQAAATPSQNMDSDSTESVAESERAAVLLLPWDDVLCKRILPLVGLSQVFRLRRVCRQFQCLVDDYYLPHLVVLDTARFGSRFCASAFAVATRSATCLRRLVLRGTKDWITDELLVPVLSQNCQLEEIDLTGCSALSNVAAQAIAVSCRSSLETLCLRDCVWISAAAVSNVALSCSRLRRVDLSGCWHVTDDAVALLAQCCRGIVYLNLSRIYGLTDRSLKALAWQLTELTHLCIQGCWRVTDEGVLALAKHASKLQCLQARECRSISETGLKAMRERKVKLDALQRHRVMSATAGSMAPQH